MKTLNMRSPLSAVLTGLALAAITFQVSFAAPNAASEPQNAAAMETAAPVASATTIAEPERVGRQSPLTLYAEDPSGNEFRLILVQGTGWKYATGWGPADREGESLFRKMAFGSRTPAPAASVAITENEPLTVFIDGPSGFMYAWHRDDGWTFVGKIADRRR